MHLTRGSLLPALGCLLLCSLAACAVAPASTQGQGRRRAPATEDATEGPADDAADPPDSKDDAEPATRKAIVVDLGAVTAGRRVALDVPPTALGFNIVVESSGEGTMEIESIESPTGEVVQAAFTPTNGGFPTSGGLHGVGSVSVPQNDLASTTKLASGKWTITFGGGGTGARATARIQSTDDGEFHGGALDLHVHVPSGLRMSSPSPTHVVDAAKAGEDPDIVARVDAFFDALERGYGIDRGKVTFHVAPAALVSVTSESSALAAAGVSKGLPDAQALHLLLTNALSIGGEELLGLSPGIPGAAMRSGTSMSGILGAHYADTDATTEALTWLHELGHFVGLQHTSEYSGTFFDPLSDTPRCPGARTATSSCPDDGNIMFTGAFADAPVITAAQKRVMRGSPIYRAFSKSRPATEAAGAGASDAPAAATLATAVSERSAAHGRVRPCGQIHR